MTNSPLNGIRVLDLTHSWAGPHATRLLADFGAEVIKIEYVKRLGLMRGGRLDNEMYNKHSRFWHLNRNKFGITLDLQETQDAEIFADLVRVSDVVLENSRPGVMQKLGFDYEPLKQLNERIILVSMSAFGQTGPESSYAAYGGSMEALGGIQALTAYSAEDMPRRIKEMDVINGILGAAAVMSALSQRQQTGQGDWIDLSQTEAATHSLIGEHFLELATNGTTSLPCGDRHPQSALQGCYPCQGEDRWLAITIHTDSEWQAFCQVTKHLEWANDPRFTTLEARKQNHDMLDALITTWTSKQNHIEAMHLLQQAGIAAGAVLTLPELCQDPHLQARNYFQKPVAGEELYPGFPFQFAQAEAIIQRRGPDLGEHNQAIIGDLLQRPASDIKPILSEQIGTCFDL